MPSVSKSTGSGRRITKVLIANRGEIAVRIIRAARDAGLGSVAVYADQDRDARHVRLADEAYALHGTTSADTYLVIEKLLSVAKRSGADAVHPGYGFLAERSEFARAVIDAGLVWVGPSPEAIDALGDKVTARHVAERVGAPLAPGTLEPVAGAEEVLAFVDEHGLPVAIKAAFGGGGRGLKVAHTREEVADQFDSATREALAAFGRGECFVEKYLDRPRHVETQCLADAYGTVVVVSTRDCSLQRRHQKLVEEAPAPFLSEEQVRTLYDSSKAILSEAGYAGAGMKSLPGSSALIRNSIEWPRTGGSSYPSSSPAAIRNISRTRTRPVTSSDTGCSTCRRVFTSRNEIVPSCPTRNSQVPAPTYPASRRIALDDL